MVILSYGGTMEITSAEGTAIEQLTSQMGLNQLLNEPTNFEPNKNPSCIDLIFTDQPNCVIESGTRSSLDNFCHHQITYCRMNFQLPPPSFKRKIWHYDRANISLIHRCISCFPWSDILNENPTQTDILNENPTQTGKLELSLKFSLTLWQILYQMKPLQ